MSTEQILESLRASIENDIRTRILANLGPTPQAAIANGSKKNGAAVKVPRPKPQRAAIGGKRTPGEIAKTAEAVFAFIKTHPGTNAEAIQKDLGEPLNVIVLPIKKLLASKSITRKGQKRATHYYAKAVKAAKGGA